MAKQSSPQLPVIEMLTPDEVKEALALFSLIRKGYSDPQAELRQSHSQVSFRNVKLPDGQTSLFAAVGVFPAAPAMREATDTPVPVEKSNG